MGRFINKNQMIKIQMQIEGKQTNKLIACAATCEFNAWMTSNIPYIQQLQKGTTLHLL